MITFAMKDARIGYTGRRIMISCVVAHAALVLHFVVEAMWFSEYVRSGSLSPVEVLSQRFTVGGTYFEALWFEANMSPWHTGWVLVLSGLTTYQLLTPNRLRIASCLVGWLLTFILIVVFLIALVAPWWIDPLDLSLVYPVSWVIATAALFGAALFMWQLGRALGSRGMPSAKSVWISSVLWLFTAGLALWLPLAPQRQVFVNPLGILAASVLSLAIGTILGWGDQQADPGQ